MRKTKKGGKACKTGWAKGKKNTLQLKKVKENVNRSKRLKCLEEMVNALISNKSEAASIALHEYLTIKMRSIIEDEQMVDSKLSPKHSIKGLDRDGDGDHDMEDHDMEDHDEDSDFDDEDHEDDDFDSDDEDSDFDDEDHEDDDFDSDDEDSDFDDEDHEDDDFDSDDEGTSKHVSDKIEKKMAESYKPRSRRSRR